jgi:hypothetical protein
MGEIYFWSLLGRKHSFDPSEQCRMSWHSTKLFDTNKITSEIIHFGDIHLRYWYIASVGLPGHQILLFIQWHKSSRISCTSQTNALGVTKGSLSSFILKYPKAWPKETDPKQYLLSPNIPPHLRRPQNRWCCLYGISRVGEEKPAFVPYENPAELVHRRCLEDLSQFGCSVDSLLFLKVSQHSMRNIFLIEELGKDQPMKNANVFIVVEWNMDNKFAVGWKSPIIRAVRNHCPSWLILSLFGVIVHLSRFYRCSRLSSVLVNSIVVWSYRPSWSRLRENLENKVWRIFRPLIGSV